MWALLLTVWSGPVAGMLSGLIPVACLCFLEEKLLRDLGEWSSRLRLSLSLTGDSTGTVLTSNFFVRNFDQDIHRIFFFTLPVLTVSSMFWPTFFRENPKQPINQLLLEFDLAEVSWIWAMEEGESNRWSGHGGFWNFIWTSNWVSIGDQKSRVIYLSIYITIAYNWRSKFIFIFIFYVIFSSSNSAVFARNIFLMKKWWINLLRKESTLDLVAELFLIHVFTFSTFSSNSTSICFRHHLSKGIINQIQSTTRIFFMAKCLALL